MRKYILFIYMVCHLLHVYAGNLENKINSSYPTFGQGFNDEKL